MKASDIGIAIEWLEMNNGEFGEMESCRAVAEFLRKELEKRDREQIVRKVSAETGASRASIVEAMKRRKMIP